MEGEFFLPVWYDLLATFAFAITGAIIGLRKHYDIVGVSALALAVGVGGGIIRDGVFLQVTPAAAVDWRYTAAIILAVLVAVVLKHRLDYKRVAIAIGFLDALGLAAYTIVGTQKALLAGMVVVGAVLVGVINATGGGVLRDLLSGDKPQIFRPSHLYALVSVGGSLIFIAMAWPMQIDIHVAAIVVMIGMVFVRMYSILFDVQTVPAGDMIKSLKKTKKSAKL